MANVFLRASAALCVMIAGAPGVAQPPAPPPQPARWHLDGATNRCVLQRQLQGSPGPVTFILRTIPASGRYDIILAGGGIERSVPNGATARLAFTGGTLSFESPAARVELPGGIGRGVALGPFARDIAAEFGRATAVRLLGADRSERGSWTVPIASRAAQVLAECERAKLVEWGADRALLEEGATPPKPLTPPSSWVSIRDFGVLNALGPAEYLAVFRVVLDETGRPSDCTLLEFASNVTLDAAFCQAMMRSARYEPARDASNRPVRSVAVETISFRTQIEFRPIN